VSPDASPHDLRTERRPTPLGVAPDEPRFGWRVPDGASDQTAYRLRVGTDPAALPDRGDVWESGVVAAGGSVTVPYAGPSLAPRTRYHWTVRVRDGDGEWSDWSEPTWFETGVADWTGEWLAPAGAAYETAPAPAPVFRTTFDLDAAVVSARLHVAAGGSCVPRVNGDRVTDRVLDPAGTDYEERVLYATYDVTDHLSAGENGIAVTCGRGRYAMTTETVWGWHDTPWQRDHPELRLELAVTLADGAEVTVATDGSWRVGPSATRFDSLYSGELYDAREADAWSRPETEARDWPRADVADGPDGDLVPQTVQPIEPVRTVAPETVTELDLDGDAGGSVVDFGEMIAGWTRLSVDVPAGTEITLVHGEKLHEDGTVDVDQGHCEEQLQTDRYVAAGGEESWEPRFSYRGFRYVQVEGLPETASLDGDGDTLTAVVAHSRVDAGSESGFECSNDLLTAIHGNTRRALLNNHHGIPTDTPTYEKNGWTGDAQLTAEAALYEFEMAPFYRKWLADFADAQRETGEVPPIVPTSDWGYSDAPHDGGILSPNPAWDAAYVLLPWWTYRYCGDAAVLAEQFEGMKRLVRFLGRYAEDGIVDEGLGDWLAPGPGPGDGESRSIPPEGPALTSSAYYYRLAEVVGAAADALGREDDAAAFSGLAARISDAINRRFLDADAGVYATGEADEYRQTSNVVPLAFGVVPDEHREAVVDALVADVRDVHDGHPNTGILGTKHLLPVLTEAGHVDLAHEVATATSYPSWGHWIVAADATSLYEAWELSSRSRNHHMFGTIDEWFYSHLAGIRPAEPGFESVVVEPHVPGDLESVSATVDTVRGPVEVDWEQTADGLRLGVEIPPNADGVVRAPGTDPVLEATPEGGAPERVTERGSRSVLELPAGGWTIRTTR